jgi:hypothetical protein
MQKSLSADRRNGSKAALPASRLDGRLIPESGLVASGA